jgi:glutaredoxin-like protein
MLLSDGDRVAIERKFSENMKDEVTLLLFSEDGSAISKELIDISNKLAGLNSKIVVSAQNSDGGKNQRMKDLRIEHTPCMLVTKGDFTRIRYFGLPAGYEIPPLVDAIAELSSSHTKLSPKAKEALSTVRRRANIKVFVLETCPYCPTVARHAYRAAIESQKVTAEIIDSSMFTDLAQRHTVLGVPKIILNDSMDITGAIMEAEFFEKLRDADHSLVDSMFG